MANINVPIAKRLKKARLAAKISQKKLGILAGIDEFSASTRMNQYETSKHIPDFLTLKKIAQVLLVPTAYFYAEEDNMAELLCLYNNLDQNSKKWILNSCKKLSYSVNLTTNEIFKIQEKILP